MDATFWRGKKVLVTGHEGFLGSWLSVRLIERGARVVGIDRAAPRPLSVLGGLRGRMTRIRGDISSAAVVRGAIDRHRPAVIFHLAAEAIVGECAANPARAFAANIQGTWNLLEAARGKAFITAIVAASSDKAYGSHRNLPYRECFPLRGDYPYDVSKSCADLICRSYFLTYGLPVCVTRCGNIYGPGDFHLERIVPEAVRCALAGVPLPIRSDGRFTRDYIYVSDIVDGYMLLASRIQGGRLAGEAFNLSAGKPLTVLELARAVYRAAGTPPAFRILNTARCEIRRQYLSSRKARRVLGWRPRHTLAKGLALTVRWYRDHPASI